MFLFPKPVMLVFFLLVAGSLPAQPFTRYKGEREEAFVKRIARQDKLPYHVIETKEWDSSRNVVIYFEKLVSAESEIVNGYILVPHNDNGYERVLIDTFYEDGGPVFIDTVFFANADPDAQKEIIVMTRNTVQHNGARVWGEFYATHIYDVPDLLHPPKRLLFLKGPSKKLESGFEGTIGNKRSKAKYKTAAEVRIALKKMGF
ncbi:hypothetical protein GWC95_06435 [Sediminibacterium roseum]|uniref:Uncharacterized protein n=1 Tax=Sediminibacterium roseum TaxID=1978412 RepID=A0ABW9ZXG1_9BACT|nr:hypothetical protein [Sediminibacterium roseum]NCI49551.1 hypothetical protein [Sediminibacterium roseum]